MIKYMITVPSHLNREPFLTEWHADVEPSKQIWIQISIDEESPVWMRLGDIFEMIVINPGIHVPLEEWIKKFYK